MLEVSPDNAGALTTAEFSGLKIRLKKCGSDGLMRVSISQLTPGRVPSHRLVDRKNRTVPRKQAPIRAVYPDKCVAESLPPTVHGWRPGPPGTGLDGIALVDLTAK